MADLYVGIETGGTKVVAGVARFEDGEPILVAPEVVVPTSHEPQAMLDGLCSSIEEIVPTEGIAAVGVGAFGPIDLRLETMLVTPKRGWSGFGLGPAIRERWGSSLLLDTDVNAAVLAEWRWGAATGAGVAIYVTVGTGIGGGAIVGGGLVRGLLHPEMGHLVVPRHPADDFEGACGSHGDCFEGLAAGPALRERWGMPGESLADDHPAWEMEAWYLGRGLAQITLAYSPEIVVLGGGVGGRDLHAGVEAALGEALDGYVPAPRVVAPHFGSRAGLMGAFALAEAAANS